MKKLLLLLAVVCLVSCSKDDENIPLTQAQQEVENAKLVGTWWRVQSDGAKERGYVFTEDFKVSISHTTGGATLFNRPYTIYSKGLVLVDFARQIKYRFEGEYLFITDWVSDYNIDTAKYERE